MDSSTWSISNVKGVKFNLFYYLSLKKIQYLRQTFVSVASDLDLHCLPMSFYRYPNMNELSHISYLKDSLLNTVFNCHQTIVSDN